MQKKKTDENVIHVSTTLRIIFSLQRVTESASLVIKDS